LIFVISSAMLEKDGSCAVVETPVKPSDVLRLHRIAVREATERFRSANPRVFGSVAHGADEEGSDIDILVDALPGATLFDLGALQVELEDLLGVSVDLLTPATCRRSFGRPFSPMRNRYKLEPARRLYRSNAYGRQVGASS
jgi:predicted nucleotidyltransferase